MAKKTFSFGKFFMNTLLVLMSGIFVNVFYETHPWTTVGLMMLIGTYYLIIISKFLFLGREYSMAGGYVLFYAGGALILSFLIWAGNMFLKIFNPFFEHLGSDFRIGYLFPGIWNFACSVPALICGAILILAGILWEHNDSYLQYLKKAVLSGN